MYFKNIKKLFFFLTLIISFNRTIVFAQNGETIFAVTNDNKFLRFNSETPSVIDEQISIVGLQAGETVLSIDESPITNQVFLFGSTGRLYTFDTNVGSATQIGSAITSLTGGIGYYLDFNPVVNKIRVVNDNSENFRFNPEDNTLFSTDITLAYSVEDLNNGQTPTIRSIAYSTNSANRSLTTLFGIDTNLNTLVRIGSANGNPVSPNSGTLYTIGGLGVDATSPAGFDISEARDNEALAVFNVNGETGQKLFNLDLAGGRANLIGVINTPLQIRDITIHRAGVIRFSQATYSVNENGGILSVYIERVGGSANPYSSGVFQPVNVNFNTINGVATSGSDYNSVSQTITFNDGDVFKKVDLQILNDSLVEGTEAFNISLTSPTGGLKLADIGTSIVYINDDEFNSSGNSFGFVSLITRSISKSDFTRRGLSIQFVCTRDCDLNAKGTISLGNARRFRLSSTTIFDKNYSGRSGVSRVVRIRPSSSIASRIRGTRGTMPMKVTLTANEIGSTSTTNKTYNVSIK